MRERIHKKVQSRATREKKSPVESINDLLVLLQWRWDISRRQAFNHLHQQMLAKLAILLSIYTSFNFRFSARFKAGLFPF